MPLLDVSFVLSDPMLADTFEVIRRAETVNDKGRVEVTEELFGDLVGVVTQQDPSDLMRREDGQLVPRSIFVASQFDFRPATIGYQPDLIRWNGTDYLVKQVYPYSRYGAGFHECVASSMSAMDVPQ